MSKITYSPRERGSHSPTKVTSWWIDGSRERYGEAYFISERTDVEDGLVKTRWVLWQNRRPYAANEQIDVFAEKPESWANLDAVIRPGATQMDVERDWYRAMGER